MDAPWFRENGRCVGFIWQCPPRWQPERSEDGDSFPSSFYNRNFLRRQAVAGADLLVARALKGARVGGGGSSRGEFGFQRLFFSKLAHSHDAEPDDVTLRVHPLHHRIVIRFLLVASGVREADFQEIRLGIEPDF